MDKTNYYDTLDISNKATVKEIAAAQIHDNVDLEDYL